jgi:hypothetical protein
MCKGQKYQDILRGKKQDELTGSNIFFSGGSITASEGILKKGQKSNFPPFFMKFI